MPSGAKKRKAAAAAAKKKKGGSGAPNNNNNNNPNSSSSSSASSHSHGDENVDFKEGGSVERIDEVEEEDNVVRVERGSKIEGGKSSSSSSTSSSSSNSGGDSDNDEPPPPAPAAVNDDDDDIKETNTQGLDEIASVLDSLKESDEALSVDPVVHHQPIQEACDLVVENVPASSLVETVVQAAPVVEENGVEKKAASFVEEEVVGPSVVALPDAPASERKESEEGIVVEEHVTVLEPKEEECGVPAVPVQEIDDKLTVSFNAPVTTTTDDDGTEHEKNVSGVTEPLLAPRPVERTSWKSCCGLFDLFSGSSS